MTTQNKTLMLNGKVYWAKILGEPPTNQFGETGWSLDVVVENPTKKELLALGFPKTKFREGTEATGGKEFISFKRKAINADGSKAKEIVVVGPDGKPWDRTQMIGNGSTVNVRYVLNEGTYKGKPYLKPAILALQVWDLVKYERTGNFPTKAVSETANTEAPW